MGDAGPRRKPETVFLAVLVVVLAVMLARSTPRSIGDGGEYLAVATNLSHLQPPSLSYKQRTEAGLDFPRLVSTDGRQDTLHFWAYPALAAVPLGVARILGLPPASAFASVNVVLLVTAAVIASSRVRWSVSALLFLSPVLWWTDKTHPEVFIFSLLAIGMLLWRDRPSIAAAALGAAAAQNPPVISVLACFAAATWLTADTAGRWRVVSASIIGVAIAAIHPAYYLLRLGRLAPLDDAAAIGGLTFASYPAVLTDLNIGLLPNDPWLAAALGIGVITMLRRRSWPSPDQLASAAAILLLLGVFGQIINLNHGGTPGMSRYALWLLPLTLPWLIAGGARWSGLTLAVLAVSGAVWSVAYFRPSLDEGHLFPTRTAVFVWQRFPGLDNPLPEIFAERLRHRENVPARAATTGCAKVLLLGGEGPPDCPVDAIPLRCRSGPCYANRTASGEYRFVVMHQRRKGNFLF